MQGLSSRVMSDSSGKRNFASIHKEAQGRAGGILKAWNKEVLEVENYIIEEFSVGCFQECGPTDHTNWVRMWSELPWCLGGDFNAIRVPSDKKRASQMHL